jgi:hypothetical protein
MPGPFVMSAHQESAKMLGMTLEEMNAALRLDGPPCRFGSPGRCASN